MPFQIISGVNLLPPAFGLRGQAKRDPALEKGAAGFARGNSRVKKRRRRSALPARPTLKTRHLLAEQAGRGQRRVRQYWCHCSSSPRPSPPGEGETVAASLARPVTGLAGREDEILKTCPVKTLSWGRGQGEGECSHILLPLLLASKTVRSASRPRSSSRTPFS